MSAAAACVGNKNTRLARCFAFGGLACFQVPAPSTNHAPLHRPARRPSNRDDGTHCLRSYDRRASQSHPPPVVQPRDDGNDGGGKGGKGGPGGWRELLKIALSHREDQAGTYVAEYGKQGQPPSGLGKNRNAEDSSGGGDADSVGSDGDGFGEDEASALRPPTAATTAVERAPSGAKETPGGDSNTDSDDQRREAGAGRERQQATRQQGQGERGREGSSTSGNDDVVPEIDSNSRENGESRGGGIETNPSMREEADTAGSQKGQRAHSSNLESEQEDGERESRQQAAWPVVYRPPPEDFWRSVEGRTLSSSELEGVLDGVTEEEAERYLRDKGMVDEDGNFKPPSSNS